jgi:hypothetical protein
MKPKSESDLAAKVIEWLEAQHWDVYQEVVFRGNGGRADIVAVRNGYLWIIETKTSLTFTVLSQASYWRSHFRSIAVPKSQDHNGGRGMAYQIAKDYLKIGVLEVNSLWVNEVIGPPLMREYHKFAKDMIGNLRPEHKTFCQAGSNGGGYFTPYRETMRDVQMYIASHPGCKLKEIVDGLKHYHYRTKSSALTCIRVALSNWEPWCEVRTGEKGEFRYYIKQ